MCSNVVMILQIFYVFRHPEADLCPSFSKLVFNLSQPDDRLLKISAENEEEFHHEQFVLGASLEAGQSLYAELQNMYKLNKIN